MQNFAKFHIINRLANQAVFWIKKYDTTNSYKKKLRCMAFRTDNY